LIDTWAEVFGVRVSRNAVRVFYAVTCAESSPVSRSDLHNATKLTQTTITRSLQFLQTGGLVRVFYLPDDQREKYVQLTPKGKRFNDKLTRLYADSHQETS